MRASEASRMGVDADANLRRQRVVHQHFEVWVTLQSPLSTLHSPFSMTGRAQQGGRAQARRGVDADANLRRHHPHKLSVGTSSGGYQGGEILYDMCFN